MYKECNKNTWYGKLKTASKSIIVIHDKRVNSTSKGKIFLYNTEKKKLSEYIEEIVIKILSDLTKEELKEAENLYKDEWNEEFSDYKKKHPKLSSGKVGSSQPIVDDNEDDDPDDNKEIDLEFNIDDEEE